MELLLTPSNITFVLGLLAIIFSVYNYFKNPQIKSEQFDALMQQRIQWTTEANEKRFCTINESVKEAFGLAQNHIHTVDTKVETLTKTIVTMSNEITRLSTIIEERIPKK